MYFTESLKNIILKSRHPFFRLKQTKTLTYGIRALIDFLDPPIPVRFIGGILLELHLTPSDQQLPEVDELLLGVLLSLRFLLRQRHLHLRQFPAHQRVTVREVRLVDRLLENQIDDALQAFLVVDDEGVHLRNQRLELLRREFVEDAAHFFVQLLRALFLFGLDGARVETGRPPSVFALVQFYVLADGYRDADADFVGVAAALAADFALLAVALGRDLFF